MGIFDGYLICSDFDGTMAFEAKVSKENCDAIAYFQSEGGVFCPTSGREAAFFHRYEDFFRPNGPVITLNGSAILRYGKTPAEDEVLYEGRIPRALGLEYMEEMLRQKGVRRVWLYQMDKTYVFYAPGEKIDEKSSKCVARPEEIVGDFRKIVTVHDNKHLSEIRAATEPIYRDRFVFGCSWEFGYEAQTIGTDKGSSARRVKEMVGAHTLVTVGDYENDYLLLRAGDISYAVGNALDCLKEVADRITVPCTEHAIAHIVEDLKNDIMQKRG